jgi:alkanesulfonate monooxygenase SsuD/methylene tetrahydromethanopterin reductase-like flavin-dependent oxidoreductase (luciferase family)
VEGAINLPKGLQSPRIPIVVGGNGPNVTSRLAARFADELNLVFLGPSQVADRLPLIRSHCEEIGRDPATLAISLYTRDDDVREPGQARVDRLGAFRELGLSRVVCFPGRWSTELETQARFAEDCRAAGLEMTGPGDASAVEEARAEAALAAER